MTEARGVYLFDDFDSIGSERGLGNDVGKIHCILSSFLQMVEQGNADTLIVAATNHVTARPRAFSVASMTLSSSTSIS